VPAHRWQMEMTATTAEVKKIAAAEALKKTGALEKRWARRARANVKMDLGVSASSKAGKDSRRSETYQ